MTDPSQSESTSAAPAESGPGNGAHPSKSTRTPSSFWSFLRSKFSSETETTLRASLEDVIGQHEAGTQDDMSAEERLMLLNILEFGQQGLDEW